jgi:hypothetical protein
VGCELVPIVKGMVRNKKNVLNLKMARLIVMSVTLLERMMMARNAGNVMALRKWIVRPAMGIMK